MEAGYGDEPEAAAATARGVVEVGAVGLNLEDLRDGGDDLLPIERFGAKIAAVRAVGEETGVPLVLNARTDVFLGQIGDPATRLERAVERGRAYLDAGADCIFVPGVVDPDVITALVQGIDGPVSVLAVPGSPAISELRRSASPGSAPAPGRTAPRSRSPGRMAEEAYGAGIARLDDLGPGRVRRRAGAVRRRRPRQSATDGRNASIV